MERRLGRPRADIRGRRARGVRGFLDPEPGWNRRSGAGAHQFASPSSVIVAGASRHRTTTGSTSTAVASARFSGTLPQGIYRCSNSVADLKAHGADDRDALINAGVFTWTLKNGSWPLKQVPVDNSVTMTTCDGYYDVRGNSVAFTTTTVYSGGDCAPKTWTARWAARDGTLAWSAASVPDASPRSGRLVRG